MKEVERLLRSIADGMKIVAVGMNTVADQLCRLTETRQTADGEGEKNTLPPAAMSGATPEAGGSEQPVPQPAAEPTYVTDASGKVVTKLKKAAIRDKKSRPATDIVLNVIRNSAGGTDNRTIAAKTGFDRKKVANVLFRLKREGKVEPVSRGIYRPV